MDLIKSHQDLEKISRKHSLGFVPTMGNWHEGHLSLIKKSQAENDKTIASIFVNPTQFNSKTDLEKYPRTLEQDIALAEKLNLDYLFLPTEKLLYPEGYTYKVQETKFSKILEGKHRPGHFDGVLTVVLKLFNLIKPTRAYFGEKDYQQLSLIKGLVKNLFLDIEIIGCPTVRDEFGLALSSRNSRLSKAGLEKAWVFANILKENNDIDIIKSKLTALNIKINYVQIYQDRLLAAVEIDNVCLIDNQILN